MLEHTIAAIPVARALADDGDALAGTGGACAMIAWELTASSVIRIEAP
ncbi:MAG TPA: hypothetical protein VNC18_03215 [Gemmatimonadaceae bacterium]|nr:hypothetical protein [Gemmatimonadaceae bacterium]HWJ13580.1 hypothetical protein [Gemmatimonadaceae bacterium]